MRLSVKSRSSEVLRPKVVLMSDFKCCQKYRHTLPRHVELVGGDMIEEPYASKKSLKTPSKSSSIFSKLSSSKDELSSELAHRTKSDYSPRSLVEDDRNEEMLEEVEFEASEEEEEYEPSICSEWIVLKPEKKIRKKEKFSAESSTSDLNEPAGTRRLMKRQPSPDGEVFDLNDLPKELIPYNFIKYQDSHLFWPEPAPLEEALLRRYPSPAMSMPKSGKDVPELTGEDWLWFEGRYLEGGTLEIAGEGGGYYRLPKQWKEGHWKPSPALVEKWEKEELEAEKERQKQLEAKRKYDEILKRAESPGMDVINWGDGPVRLTNWTALMKDPSGELSRLLPRGVSDFILEETAKLGPQELDELSNKVGEALMNNSYVMVRDILMEYFFDKLGDWSELGGLESELKQEEGESKLELHLSGSEGGLGGLKFEDGLAIGDESIPRMASKSRSVTFRDGKGMSSQFLGSASEADSKEEVSEEATKKEPIVKEVPCDVIPEPFRNILLDFVRHFVADLPSDPLQYAIDHFEQRIPHIEEKGEDMAETKDFGPQRRMAIGQHTHFDEEFSVYEKSKEDVDKLVKTLNDCWYTKDLDLKNLLALVEVMFEVDVKENEIVQFEDTPLHHFFIVKRGAFKLENNREVKIVKDRGFVGENSLNMMLSQNFESPYTVTALSDGALWCLRSGDFANITADFRVQKETLVLGLMQMMDLFKNATDDERYNVVDTLETRFYRRKDIIFCQNRVPDGVYFILNGTFKLVKLSPIKRGSKEQTKKKGKMEYFSRTCAAPRTLGHGNLSESKPWDYSCVAKSNIVEVAVLKTDVFERLFGDVEDLLHRPPPPPPKVKPVAVEQEVFGEGEEMVGEAEVEFVGEWGEAEVEKKPEPPAPKVIPWLKKKSFEEEKPPPMIEPTLQEILDSIWAPKITCTHAEFKLPCGCGAPECPNAACICPPNICPST